MFFANIHALVKVLKQVLTGKERCTNVRGLKYTRSLYRWDKYKLLLTINSTLW